MIIPAIRLMDCLCEVIQLITCVLYAEEIIAKMSRGSAIPIPKRMKLKRLAMKLTVDVLIANNIINEAGLQGRTIIPKKNPNINELQ